MSIRELRRAVGFVLPVLLVLSAQAESGSWYTVTTSTKTMENSKLKVRYGSPPSGYWGNGIVEFRYKPYNENYGYTLDCYGCASGTYDHSGPSSYTLSSAEPDMVEVAVHFDDCVTVRKKERLFRDLPVFEIEYDTLEHNNTILWWEDFFDNPNTPTVLSFWGVANDINQSTFGTYANGCSDGDNWLTYGSCFIENAGSNAADSRYDALYYIFGTHSQSTGRGIGEVHSSRIGLVNWKPWWSDRPVFNYELFPQAYLQRPFKRWIYAYEGGRTGCFEMGQKIADCVTNGIGMPECFDVATTTRQAEKREGEKLTRERIIVRSVSGNPVVGTTLGDAAHIDMFDITGRSVDVRRPRHGAGRQGGAWVVRVRTEEGRTLTGSVVF